MNRPRPHFWVMISGAALALVGAFLPWVTVTAAFVSVSKNGIEADGRFTVVMSIVAGILVLVYLRAASRPSAVLIIVAVLGGLVALVGIIDFVDVNNRIGNLTAAESTLVAASVGVGLYLTIAAGVTLMVGAIMGVSAD